MTDLPAHADESPSVVYSNPQRLEGSSMENTPPSSIPDPQMIIVEFEEYHDNNGNEENREAANKKKHVFRMM